MAEMTWIMGHRPQMSVYLVFRVEVLTGSSHGDRREVGAIAEALL